MGMKKKIVIGIILFMFFISSTQILFNNPTSGQSSIKTMKSSSSNNSWSMFGGNDQHIGSIDTSLKTNTSANWNLTSVNWQGFNTEYLWINTPTVENGIIAEATKVCIYLINETTGNIIWIIPYTCASNLTYSDYMPNQYYSYSAIAYGNVYVSNPWTNQIFCINTNNPYNVIWNITLPNPVYCSPVAYNGSIYIGAYNGTIYSLNATNGNIEWTYGDPSPGQITIMPTVFDGYVYYIDNINGIYCLNTNDNGSLFWNNTDLGHFGNYSPLISVSDRLFTEDDNGNLYCIDNNNGNLIWQYNVNGQNIETAPAYWNNSIFIDSSNYTYCIDYNTGALIWSHYIGGNILSSPAVSNGYIYFTGGDGTQNQNIATNGVFNGSTYLYCLNANDGSLLWKFKGYSKGLFACTPAIADGNVFVDDGYFLYSVPMNLISITVPSAPFGLTTTNNNNSAFLTWNPPIDDGNSPITGYKIYRGTTFDNETYLTTVGNVLNYTDTGLKDNQIYYYQVSAINSAGESPKSNVTSMTTSAGVPSVPLDLNISSSGHTVILSWDPPVNDGGVYIYGYNIYRGTSSGNEVYVTTVFGTDLNFTDTGLKAGQTYYYEVTAISKIGESPKSAETSVTLANNNIVNLVITIIISLGALAIVLAIAFYLYKRRNSRNKTNLDDKMDDKLVEKRNVGSK